MVSDSFLLSKVGYAAQFGGKGVTGFPHSKGEVQ